MNLFDCQFLSNPSSVNRSYPENQQKIDNQEKSNLHSTSINDSTSQEMSSPYGTNNVPRNPEKIQRAIYKGPDVFGKVLGPTADESILVGLQALLDMAGSLEFTNFNCDVKRPETPVENASKESRDVSEAITQNSASCQCSVEPEKHGMENHQFKDFQEELQNKVVHEVRDKSCNYIITQENIAAVNPRRTKCQHSQTRVLPASMTCYDPERDDYSCFQSPCKCLPRSITPSVRCSRQTPPSLMPSVDCRCSQFYHQMTTISVLENTPEETHTCPPCCQAPRTSCEVVEQPNLIIPNNLKPSVDAASAAVPEMISVASEPTKETSSIPIQTLPIPRPVTANANVETDSVESLEKSSVACDCNFCIPISAGVSAPPSVASEVCKRPSSVRFADEVGAGSICSVFCDPVEKIEEKRKDMPARKNKSCSCSLIPKGVRVADAAISCLKVNTSCQYYTSEIRSIESRSTQCKLNDRRDSCLQICSESGGDFRPRGKKSVRILSGPFDCQDFSETRYCMETKKTNSESVLPILDCTDEISKIFEQPRRISMEMGDSFIPPPMEVRYAITKITKFRDFSTFEVMKSTSKKPKCLPKAVEGVFVLKKEENYCPSRAFNE